MSDARAEYFAVALEHKQAVAKELDRLTDLEDAFSDWCDAVRKTGRLVMESYDKAEAVRVEATKESSTLGWIILDMKRELDRLSALHPKPTEGET
jgi:hypothetical protein